MRVIVKGMAMPKNCAECPCGQNEMWCWKTGSELADDFCEVRLADCPLVEVKEPHGRLGDLDALKAQYKYGEADSEDERLWMMNIRRAITNAPTVIDAEGSET